MSILLSLKIDYNGDIKDLLPIITEIASIKGSVREDKDASAPCYHFEYSDWNAYPSLHENSFYWEGSIYSIGRFKVLINGPDCYECLMGMTSLLSLRTDLSFEAREMIHMTDFEYYPTEFKPNFSIITRHMPAVIMIKGKNFKQELKKLTGIRRCDSSYHYPVEGVRYAYNRITCLDYPSELYDHYDRFQATHRIDIFGIDADPSRRRFLRDSYALSLYENICVIDKVETRLYEIANGKVRTFGSVSDE